MNYRAVTKICYGILVYGSILTIQIIINQSIVEWLVGFMGGIKIYKTLDSLVFARQKYNNQLSIDWWA